MTYEQKIFKTEIHFLKLERIISYTCNHFNLVQFWHNPNFHKEITVGYYNSIFTSNFSAN